MKPTSTSLLHPLGSKPTHAPMANLKGYRNAVNQMQTRFDANNRELNRKKFNE